MRISSIIVTAFISGAVGAIAGILLAPEKGAKSRKEIAKKGQNYKEYLLENINDFTNSVMHPFEDVEDQAKRLKNNATNKAKKLKANALQKVNNENK